MHYQKQQSFIYFILGLKNKSMRKIMFLLLLFASCKENLPERIYVSSDEVTGGFYKFSLELKSDGRVDLDLIVSIAEEQDKSGVEWESYNNKISGKWSMDGKSIKCILDKPKTSIDSIFIGSTFNYINKPVISFSSQMDTAYIYGIPCPLVDVSKK